MSRLGMADLGVATLNDMRDNAGMIASLDRSIPVIADADTGYGGACFPILKKKVSTRIAGLYRDSRSRSLTSQAHSKSAAPSRSTCPRA